MAEVPIVVLWRPGCPFCRRLLRRLDRVGLAHERRDIWQDEQAAAAVRAAAGGNETVPTVLVGDRALVNPTMRELLAVVGELAPDQLPEDPSPRRGIGSWLRPRPGSTS